MLYNMLCVFVRSNNILLSHKLAKNDGQADEQIFILACSCVILCSVLLSHAMQVYLGEPRINAISCTYQHSSYQTHRTFSAMLVLWLPPLHLTLRSIVLAHFDTHL